MGFRKKNCTPIFLYNTYSNLNIFFLINSFDPDSVVERLSDVLYIYICVFLYYIVQFLVSFLNSYHRTTFTMVAESVMGIALLC